MKYWIEASQKYKFSVARFRTTARTATHRYKVYTIPKRNGGQRTICHPARRVKAYQYYLINDILKEIKTHQCCMAYEVGCSTFRNANYHADSKYFVRIDLKQYFESFLAVDVYKFLRETAGERMDDEDADLAAQICCRNGRLTIGGPVSPIITNRMMFQFDDSVNVWCQQNKLRYTRYADDMVISSGRIFDKVVVINYIRGQLSSAKYGRLTINDEKTKVMSGKGRRNINGLNITNDGRAVVPRELKRQIRSMIYSGVTSITQKAKLVGLINYIEGIEPGIKEKLLRKYNEKYTAIIGSGETVGPSNG